VVQFLLDNGANPDAVDDWNVTPLHNAAGAGKVDIVRELCEAGADTDARTAAKSKTPIDIARDKGKFDVIPVIQVNLRGFLKEGNLYLSYLEMNLIISSPTLFC